MFVCLFVWESLPTLNEEGDDGFQTCLTLVLTRRKELVKKEACTLLVGGVGMGEGWQE